MTDSFAVHLGGGAYLDASGNIVFGPPSGAQIYETPGGFRLDLKPVQEAFKDLSDILPHDEAGMKKWKDWGVSENIVNFLGSVAGVAGIVATAISVYAWAIGVLLKIMSEMAKGDGMSPELATTLTSIKNQLQGNEQIERADNMIKMHAEFDGRIHRMKTLLARLNVENPVGATRAQIFADMQAIVDELAVPLSNLRNQAWATTYDPDAYNGRAFASGLLVFLRPDGSLAPVPQQAPSVTVFDYRLGVPMLLYGATAFTALLEIAMPWFRSTGMYASQLRTTADTIDRFVLRMQDECLSRTEYTPTTVLQQQTWPIFEIPMAMDTGPKAWWNPASSYAVGAFDLVRYNDTFLGERWDAQFQAGEDTGPRGLFNYHWSTPAKLLEDVAAAANEQARQDYANLQVATGMFRLISTAAWLRFLSTPPDRSQTVSGFAAESRHFRDEAPTTAKSPPILATVIEHAATLKRYDAHNRVSVTTQEPGYVPAFRYRIVLRTIDSLLPFGEGGWDPRGYVGEVWRADYEPTQGAPPCKRLRTELRQNLILSEVVLYEGPSPSQAVTRRSPEPVRLRATTFDWYVPVVSPWSPYADIPKEVLTAKDVSDGGNKTTLGTGGVSIHLLGNEALAPATLNIIRNPAPLVATVVDDFWELGDLVSSSHISLDKAERRHVKIEDVKIEWQLNWTEGKLEVRMVGRPEDRPFQVHVVVEEIVYSGETLPASPGDILSNQQLVERIHTPFVAEMVNQLVLVPEEFFTKEGKAMEEGDKMLREFDRRFAEQGPVGPGDPVEFLQKSIRELAARSSSTATLATISDMRVEFAMRQAPELWNAVLREEHRTTTAS
jgi:hypothetical protein